jgi:hypothetical protein
MTNPNDPLWNPDAPADEELDRIQLALAPYGARARGLVMPIIPVHRRPLRRALPWAMAAGIALLLLGAGYQYRLAWAPGSTWSVVRYESSGSKEKTQLQLGHRLETSTHEMATITVARIGSIALSPDSIMRLVETKTGKHRVALEQGHMRARIWAPPDYFGVRTDAGEVVDLGCDFDLWKERNGSGRVFVRSGWISYRVGNEDILVPKGYALSFVNQKAGTPLRPDAPASLRTAVHALETALSSKTVRSVELYDATERVADAARDQDAFTLLSLLTRWPSLARTPLYPRLATALRVQGDSTDHRSAWEEGDLEAIDMWWDKLPRQPKQWWTHWRDVLG